MSKKSEGKYKPTLVYPSFIEHIARVREYGVNKHGHSEDWRTTPKVFHINATQRHINVYTSGEEFDQESGLPHLAHAACNLMFEIERAYGSGIIEDLFHSCKNNL
jgi:hypothetical protein